MSRTVTDPARHDPVVVRCLAAGQRVQGRVCPADAWEATRRLAARGYSDSQIAELVQRTQRTVLRIRAALGVPAPCRGLSGYERPVNPVPRPGLMKDW